MSNRNCFLGFLGFTAILGQIFALPLSANAVVAGPGDALLAVTVDGSTTSKSIALDSDGSTQFATIINAADGSWKLTLLGTLDNLASDGEVSYNGPIEFANLTNVTRSVQLKLTAPTAQGLSDTLHGGTVTLTLNINSNGGAISSIGSNYVCAATTDGATVGQLFAFPFSMGNSGGSAIMTTTGGFGLPVPSLAGPALQSTFGITSIFSITGGEIATIASVYKIKGTPIVAPPAGPETPEVITDGEGTPPPPAGKPVNPANAGGKTSFGNSIVPNVIDGEEVAAPTATAIPTPEATMPPASVEIPIVIETPAVIATPIPATPIVGGGNPIVGGGNPETPSVQAVPPMASLKIYKPGKRRNITQVEINAVGGNIGLLARLQAKGRGFTCDVAKVMLQPESKIKYRVSSSVRSAKLRLLATDDANMKEVLVATKTIKNSNGTKSGLVNAKGICPVRIAKK